MLIVVFFFSVVIKHAVKIILEGTPFNPQKNSYHYPRYNSIQFSKIPRQFEWVHITRV